MDFFDLRKNMNNILVVQQDNASELSFQSIFYNFLQSTNGALMQINVLVDDYCLIGLFVIIT